MKHLARAKRSGLRGAAMPAAALGAVAVGAFAIGGSKKLNLERESAAL